MATRTPMPMMASAMRAVLLLRGALARLLLLLLLLLLLARTGGDDDGGGCGRPGRRGGEAAVGPLEPMHANCCSTFWARALQLGGGWVPRAIHSY